MSVLYPFLSIPRFYKDKNKTVSGIELDSKTNMKEFMIAVLEDNNKSQRTVGFSDADIIEVFEQSVEIMALSE